MHATRAYLDWNASAPLNEAARSAFVGAAGLANPSSVHAEGRAARAAVERARGEVAALCAAVPANVTFVSGASEAAATLLSPEWRFARSRLRFSRLYMSATEHPAVLSGGRFAPDTVTRIGVDGDGLLVLPALEAALAAHDRDDGLPLVAVHLANNETGVIQPIAAIAAIVQGAGGRLIVDAAQGGGRLSLDISTLGADFLILSSHKIGGPKGAGAIVAASDLLVPVALIGGGGQEKGRRAGTENVPAIAGFGAAAGVAAGDLAEATRISALRDRFAGTLRDRLPDALILGHSAPRLCNTLAFQLPGVKAETVQIAFDLAGVSVSAGAACSSGKTARSHVADAMGFDGELGAVRVSIGPATGEAELKAFDRALAGLAARRRAA